MAIKIDLLPATVGLKRQLKLALLVSAGVLVVAGSTLAVLSEQKRLELEKVVADRNMYQAIALKTTAARQAAETAKTAKAPFEAAIKFMSSATQTGPERAALLNLLRQYIYENSVVRAIDISDGTNVTIRATVRDPDEYARFLFNLRRASDVNGGLLFAGLPKASGPGGFANGARPFVLPNPAPGEQPVIIIYPIEVTATGVLKNPVTVPADPVGTAPAPGAAPEGGGPPGGPPGGGPPAGAPGAP